MESQTIEAEISSADLHLQSNNLPNHKEDKSPVPSGPSPFEIVAESLRNLREGLQSVVEVSLFHEPTRMGFRENKEPKLNLDPIVKAGLRSSKLCEDLFLIIGGNSEGVMQIRQVLAQTHLSIQHLLISLSEVPNTSEISPGDVMGKVIGDFHNTSAALAESIIFIEALHFGEKR